LGHERVAVVPLAFQRDEQRAWRHRARIDDQASKSAITGRPAELTAGCL
jgi:hypothetical protein